MVLGIVVVLLVAGAAAFLVTARQQTAVVTTGPTAGAEAELGADPGLVFRRTAIDDTYGRVAAVPLDDLRAAPVVGGLDCERVDLVAAGGVCLAGDRGVVSNSITRLLGPGLEVLHEIPTPGTPSRARVSPDGQWVATTTFVAGHSYTSVGLSTVTTVYDRESGESLGNLEDWDLTYRSRPYTAEDVNFWGVTFRPGTDEFFATVQTQGRVHLVEGDIAARALEMTDLAVECPSVSPSGTHIAYKAAVRPGFWHIRVRELASGEEVTLAEERSVDDQVQWLDDETILYGLPREGEAVTDVWSAASDGSAQPELAVEAAWSPAVVRSGASSERS
jgi:hypothetical protein